jgi:hypothetical protein
MGQYLGNVPWDSRNRLGRLRGWDTWDRWDRRDSDR